MTGAAHRLAGMIIACAVGLSLAACTAATQGPDVDVDGAVVRLPVGANTAMYFTVTNRGDESDRLVSVSVDFAAAELHESSMEDGRMVMRPIDGVEVPSGQTVVFEPGGMHVMLMNVDPLTVGQIVEAGLTFEKSGPMRIEAVVREYGDD